MNRMFQNVHSFNPILAFETSYRTFEKFNACVGKLNIKINLN